LFRQIIDEHFAYISSCSDRLLSNDCGWSTSLRKHFILKLALPGVTHAFLAILKSCSLSSVLFVGLCSHIISFLAVLEVHRRSFYTSLEAFKAEVISTAVIVAKVNAVSLYALKL
jgi:hypothetical protein